MSRLFIALGYESRKNEARPTVVYAGPDSAELATALASSPHPVHQIFHRPAGGMFKQNVNAAANAEKLVLAMEGTVTLSKKHLAELEEEMAKVVLLAADRNAAAERLSAHVEDLQGRIAARVTEAEELRATIAAQAAELEALRASAPTEIPPAKEETSPSPSPEPTAAEPASPPEEEAPAASATRRGSRRS